MRDLTHAIRTLARTPFVTAVAALSLGLGIGANAAIYSMFHQMVRQDLRVPEPARLVNLEAPGPKSGSQSCGMAGTCEAVFSYPMFRDLQKGSPSGLLGLAGHTDLDANVTFERRSFAVEGLFVSGTYFPLLRLQPHLGRLLGPADDETPGAHPVVVVAHRFWELQLGADSGTVGRTLLVNGTPMTIVGVAPRGFEGTTVGNRPMYFVPLAMSVTVGGGIERQIDQRRAYWIYAFGRLAPGATIAEARRSLNGIYRPILNEVEAPLQTSMPDSQLARFRAREIVLSDGRRGQSGIREEAGSVLYMLFAITGLVLLIACANVANILMARATGREMEMAVRLSLGATRRQLLAQLLTESVTLAMLGGVVSIAFASWTLNGIVAMLPQEVAEGLGLGLNWAAVWFAAALALLTGIAFGLFPALHGTRPDLVTAMRNNSGKLAGGKGARRFRSSLATAQVALATALLMSAGLFLKSLWKVSRVDVGVSAERLVRFRLAPQRSGYDSVRVRELFRRVEDELAGLPGAVAVTSSRVPLIAGSNWTNAIKVEGYEPPPNADRAWQASFNAVGPNHFRAIGVPLLAGREFSDADVLGRPKVAIVNEAFARKFDLGANPVGKRMAVGRADSIPLDVEIVGLVRDMKYSNVKSEIPAVFFFPHRQQADLGQLHFYVRTDGDPNAIVRAIPPLVRRIDPLLPVEELKTLPQEIRENTFQDRMISTLSASFALLATLLAAVGLYGVLAYSVAQRTREIGVRMALGAGTAQVRGLVVRQVGRMLLVGGAIGLAAAMGFGKLAQNMLYQMSSADPAVMAAAALLLAVVALAAGYVPARRATRVDPMQALRYE